MRSKFGILVGQEEMKQEGQAMTEVRGRGLCALFTGRDSPVGIQHPFHLDVSNPEIHCDPWIFTRTKPWYRGYQIMVLTGSFSWKLL